MKSWVLVIIVAAVATLAGVAVYLFLAPAPQVTTPPGNPGGPGSGPVFALTLGSPTESTRSGSNLYNFSVVRAGSNLTWGDLAFNLTSSSGSPIVPSGTGWGVTTFNSAGARIAMFSLGTESPTWTTGGNSIAASGEWLLLESPSATSLSGDTMVIFGASGGVHGSYSTLIP